MTGVKKNFLKLTLDKSHFITESWGDLKSILIPVLILLVASTILVMGVSGKVTQGIIQRSKRKESEKQS